MNANRPQSALPDLFSEPAPSLPPANQASPADMASLVRHILPKDLPGAIRQLTDQELDQLHAAVLTELQHRGKKPPLNENLRKPRAQEVAVPLTIGKLNAIRAAFKAGMTPARIARQFRISQSDVRKALAKQD